MKTFGHYNLEELSHLGYTPVGMPALVVGDMRNVTHEKSQDAIKKTNGEIVYDAIACYWKKDAPDSIGHMQIIGNADGKDFLILQALRKI